MTEIEADLGLRMLGLAILAFTRIVFVTIQAPILASRHYKGQLKVGFAAALTLVAFPTLPMPEYYPSEFLGFIQCILMQIIVGLAIGLVSFMVMAGAQFGGEMMDIQMGLSVAASMDPSSGGASKLLNRLSFYTAMLLYLVVDGHHQLLIAIYQSFRIIPLTGFRITGELTEQLIAWTGQIFVIGIRIAAPALAALFITQVALGLLARVAPQMNVFMLSFPLNIAIGLMMFSVGLPMIMKSLLIRFEENDNQLRSTIQILAPLPVIPPPTWAPRGGG